MTESTGMSAIIVLPVIQVVIYIGGRLYNGLGVGRC